MNRPVILCCSPRAGGNSDAAANAFTRGVCAAGGDVHVVKLREYRIAACLGCGGCAENPATGCVITQNRAGDAAEAIFQLFMSAPFVFISSPIYFYHLPSGFKALIDRAQAHYVRRCAADPHMLSLPKRKAYCCLVAGRPRGERLFEGSLLTLKYFLAVFNFTMAKPLTFRGKDEPEDLLGDADAQLAAWTYGTRAVQELKESTGSLNA